MFRKNVYNWKINCYNNCDVIMFNMLIDPTKLSRPSKLQPQIFKVFKKVQKNPTEYVVVLDQDNQVMGAIVSPQMLERCLPGREFAGWEKMSEKSFDFWNHKDDDVFDDFYAQK